MRCADRSLLFIPLCAAIIALSSLSLHRAPEHSATLDARLKHLRNLQPNAGADDAWRDINWPGSHTAEMDGAWSAINWPGSRTAEAHDENVMAADKARDEMSSKASGGSDDVGNSCPDSRVPEEPADQKNVQARKDAEQSAKQERKEQGTKEMDNDDGELESTIEDEKRVGMCAAAASEQVQCVINSGGGARGECVTRKIAACLARLEVVKSGSMVSTVLVRTKYGRMVLPLADSFEGLALLLYGEWMEWGVDVLAHLVNSGATILDVNPGTGGVTLALARMVGAAGRVLVSEPRLLFKQSLAASVNISGMDLASFVFLPCLSSQVEAKDMLEMNATRATGMGKVEGADALRAHTRSPSSCSTVDREFAERQRVDLIRISACALHQWRQVLLGAAHTLRANQPILYIESRGRGEVSREVESFLAGEMGLASLYRCYWSAGRMFRANNWRQVRTNIFDDSLSVFYQLCVPSRIQLHGLRAVSEDPNHKHKQVALGDVLFSTFVTLSLSVWTGKPVILPASVSPRPLTPRATLLFDYPQVLQIDNLLDPTECEHLISLAKVNKRVSAVGIGGGQGGSEVSNVRRSHSSTIPSSDDTAASIRRRVAALLSSSVDHLELVQVVQYDEGGLYGLHNDAFPFAATLPHERQPLLGGQRIATAIIYLNDVESGGETSFPKLDVGGFSLRIRPIRGRAVVFFPADLSGVLDHRLAHESLVVEKGSRKFIATVWLRQHVTNSRLKK
jgi:prolyl 4-hydroxylase